MALFTNRGLEMLNQSLGSLVNSDFARAQAQQAQGNYAQQFGLQKMASERAQKQMDFNQTQARQGQAIAAFWNKVKTAPSSTPELQKMADALQREVDPTKSAEAIAQMPPDYRRAMQEAWSDVVRGKQEGAFPSYWGSLVGGSPAESQNIAHQIMTEVSRTQAQQENEKPIGGEPGIFGKIGRGASAFANSLSELPLVSATSKYVLGMPGRTASPKTMSGDSPELAQAKLLALQKLIQARSLGPLAPINFENGTQMVPNEQYQPQFQQQQYPLQ